MTDNDIIRTLVDIVIFSVNTFKKTGKAIVNLPLPKVEAYMEVMNHFIGRQNTDRPNDTAAMARNRFLDMHKNQFAMFGIARPDRDSGIQYDGIEYREKDSDILITLDDILQNGMTQVFDFPAKRK
jgi:hypothetical protein